MLAEMLSPFFTWLRRRTAESILAGFHDATKALSTAAAAETEPSSDIPAGVVLLLEAKPAKKGRS